jgi:hypothetical protein
VAESRVGALQIGRRSMIVCAALVVPPDSGVYVPQELANRRVGLDYGNGTAYAGLQMLEGAVPRDAVTTCAAVTHPGERYAAMLRGEFDAIVLQEPWITVAEKAVRRIKADKRRYVSYFKEGWAAGDPEVQALTPDDFNLGRIQLREPTPIPEDEARWAWDWMASWGLIDGTFDVTAQINRKIAREAHELAFAAPSR